MEGVNLRELTNRGAKIRRSLKTKNFDLSDLTGKAKASTR